MMSDSGKERKTYSSQLPVTSCQLAGMSCLRSLTLEDIVAVCDPVLNGALALINLLSFMSAAKGVKKISDY
jgi:hypothetical protein